MAYSNLICNYKTRLMPIIGYPMDHSNAAQVYNKLFEIYNINKIMFPIEIKPEDLGDYVKAAKTLHIDMYTLTMPLKSAIIPYLDEVDPVSYTHLPPVLSYAFSDNPKHSELYKSFYKVPADDSFPIKALPDSNTDQWDFR